MSADIHDEFRSFHQQLTTPRSVLEQRGWTVLQMYGAAKARLEESHTEGLTLSGALRAIAREVLEGEVAAANSTAPGASTPSCSGRSLRAALMPTSARRPWRWGFGARRVGVG